MKLILLLAGPYSSCIKTQQIWQEACVKAGVELDIFDLESGHGQRLAEQLNLKSFPALILNNKVIAVGNPNEKKAAQIISELDSISS